MTNNRKEYLRNYQREWVKKRRKSYFCDKQCVKCGSKERLELDHIDPDQKTDHNIWSWSKERRDKELKKCQVLCNSCHLEKSKKYFSKLYCGTNSVKSKFTEDEVLKIRNLYNTTDISHQELADKFGVVKSTIGRIVRKEAYSNI